MSRSIPLLSHMGLSTCAMLRGNVTELSSVDHRGEEVKHDFRRQAVVAIVINATLDNIMIVLLRFLHST